MSQRLLKTVRVLAQDCETIAAACRKIEREITVADATGWPADEGQLERMVQRIERRAVAAFRGIGVGV